EFQDVGPAAQGTPGPDRVEVPGPQPFEREGSPFFQRALVACEAVVSRRFGSLLFGGTEEVDSEREELLALSVHKGPGVVALLPPEEAVLRRSSRCTGSASETQPEQKRSEAGNPEQDQSLGTTTPRFPSRWRPDRSVHQNSPSSGCRWAGFDICMLKRSRTPWMNSKLVWLRPCSPPYKDSRQAAEDSNFPGVYLSEVFLVV